jgi:Ca2+-binding RTX toxin-like protein/uncharacterized lipoprotein NlpE involved in copper resistance
MKEMHMSSGTNESEIATDLASELDAPAPRARITIDASGAASMNFEAYIRGGFESDATGGGFPVFDNGSAFEGEEMFIGYGSGAASKYVLMHGDIEYYFGTHTVAGTANTVEYGTRGNGTYDANGYFTGGNVELRISGLDLSNAIPTNGTEEKQIEANGAIHNFAIAHMYGAPTSATQVRYDKYADSLDDYAQDYLGSSGTDIYTGTQFDDTIAGNGGDDTLAGGSGDDVIDGGAGEDAAIYTGNRADYTLDQQDDGSWTITDNRTGLINDGIDTLRNIEAATFADETVSLDEAPSSELPTRFTGSQGVEWNFSTVDVAGDAPAGTVVATLTLHYPDNWYEGEPGAIYIGFRDAQVADGSPINTYGLFDFVETAADTAANTVTFEVTLLKDVSASDLKGDFAMNLFALGYSADFNSEYYDDVSVKMDLGGDGYVVPDNHAPTDLSLSKRTVAAGAPAGTVIGTLSATDEDGDPITYVLESDNAGRLALVTEGGVTSVVMNRQAASTVGSAYVIGVKAVDENGAWTRQTFQINIVQPEINVAPTNVSLSANSIGEDASIGSVVGTLSATDANGDVLTYSLTDNADGKFSLLTENGLTRLVVNSALDYESATSHDVSVKVSDGKGGETTKTFTVNVTDVFDDAGSNTAPTNIAISNDSLSESARAGSVVGTLSATDADGDPITWTLNPGQGDNDNAFALKTNADGTVSVILKSALNHESLNGGVYDLVVTASDTNGNSTTKTIEITAEDYPLIFSASPTGKDYAAISEAAEVGQKIGLISAFDSDFTVASVSLADDFDGTFSIVEGIYNGATAYYLAVNKPLDYETLQSYDVTFNVTDTTGVSRTHTIDLQVLDAADEASDTARGTITIDAATALAGANGGVNWDDYVERYFNQQTGGLPYTSGTSWFTKSDTWTYANSLGLLTLKGSDIIYNWVDPISGEDVHVVSGSISEMVFGAGTTTVTNPEVTITGLDLYNDTSLINRIAGDVNSMASAFMHGPDGKTPAEILAVEAILDSYAQNFKGSAGNDTYTGTIFNDTISGGGGSDTLNGGAGEDTAVYTGNRADYSIIKNERGTWTVTDNRASTINDGVDHLTAIELLQFADETVAIDAVDQPTNAAPDDLALSSNAVAENSALGTVVGVLSATDADGDALAYTLTDDAGGKFSLVTESGITKLVVNGPLDYESADRHQVTVKVEDGYGGLTTETFTVSVTDVVEQANSAPSNVTLSASTVAENSAKGTVVGILSAIDVDGDALAYALADDGGGKFSLVTTGGITSLVVNGALDYETATGHQVSVKVTDGKGGETTQSFSIGVTDVDDAPAAGTITIDASGSDGMNFESYIRGGFLVGTPGSGYPVFDNSGSFSGEEMLIGYGSGASDKYVLMHGSLTYNFGYHTIGGTATTIQYGTRGSGAYDANGYFVGGDAELTITGLNLSNAIPTSSAEELAIEANGVIHNFTAAHMKGSAAEAVRLAVYADALDAYAQNFIGSTGNDVFAGSRFNDTIEGNGGSDVFDGGAGADLIVFSGAKADYAVLKDSAGTYVTVTQLSSGAVTTLANIERAQFSDGAIDLSNLEESDNKAPTNLTLSASSVAENAAIDTVIGTLSATDEDGDLLTYTLTDDAQGRFKLVSTGGITQLVLAAAVDFETATRHPVTVQVSDGKGGVMTQSFTIDVLDIDEGNTTVDISLSNASIAEDAALGAVVGRLSLAQAEGDVTWSLSGGAGKFAVDTNGKGIARLVVDGKLDYETRTDYELTLTADDGENSISETFTINVTDVAELVRGSSADDRLKGDATADILKGGAGRDTLIGGGGADRLTGGSGADTFVFTAISQSTPDSFDVITDFKGRQGDRIDLSGIDAVQGVNGSQGFDFIGRNDFSGTAGELRFETTGKRTLIEGDVDGDGNADFMIQILGTLNMKEEFFVL